MGSEPPCQGKILDTTNQESKTRFIDTKNILRFIAKKLCPDLVIIPGDMKKYAAVSDIVRAVFSEYDPNFSPMSLDEAYLDITEYLEKHAGQTASQVVQVRVMEGYQSVEGGYDKRKN